MAAKIFAGVALALVCLSDAKTALLLIDVQTCFIEGGTLPIAGASEIIPNINHILQNKACLFDKIIMSQDYHPAKHISFATTHGKAVTPGQAYHGSVDLTCLNKDTTAESACCPTVHIDKASVNCTTTHCPADDFYTTSPGSEIITDNAACTTCKSDPSKCYRMNGTNAQSLWSDHCLQDGDSGFAAALNTTGVTRTIIQKGTNQFVDAYSAFMDNTKSLMTTLDSELQAAGVTELYVAGLATDVCVRWTVQDALLPQTGSYSVKVIIDASKGIFTSDADSTQWFTQQGAQVVNTSDVVSMKCGANTEDFSRASRWSAPLVLLLAMVLAVTV